MHHQHNSNGGDSESMASIDGDGQWGSTVIGRMEVDWLSAPSPPPVVDMLSSNDPFLATSTVSSWPLSRWGASLSPREEATAHDHSLYCRKAVIEFMDPFGDELSLEDFSAASPSYFSTLMEERQTCSNQGSPFHSSAHDDLPQIDPSHMEWLETFGPIDTENGGLEAGLDAVADQVNWTEWNKYLGDEKEEEKPSTSKDETRAVYQHTVSYTPLVPRSSSLLTAQFTPVDPEPVYPLSAIAKQEIDEYSCYEPDEEIKPPVTANPTHSITTFSRSQQLFEERPKSKRGRPKKIRKPEDKNRMTVSERRKAMNRDAALRYRERRKQEADALLKQQYDLSTRNDELRLVECNLQIEVAQMKARLRDVGCPCF